MTSACALSSRCGASTSWSVWADGGYAGQLAEWVRKVYHRTLEIVKRPDDLTGFVVPPRRWIVERTFSWLYRNRRLNRDYELLPEEQ